MIKSAHYLPFRGRALHTVTVCTAPEPGPAPESAQLLNIGWVCTQVGGGKTNIDICPDEFNKKYILLAIFSQIYQAVCKQ